MSAGISPDTIIGEYGLYNLSDAAFVGIQKADAIILWRSFAESVEKYVNIKFHGANRSIKEAAAKELWDRVLSWIDQNKPATEMSSRILSNNLMLQQKSISEAVKQTDLIAAGQSVAQNYVDALRWYENTSLLLDITKTRLQEIFPTATPKQMALAMAYLFGKTGAQTAPFTNMALTNYIIGLIKDVESGQKEVITFVPFGESLEETFKSLPEGKEVRTALLKEGAKVPQEFLPSSKEQKRNIKSFGIATKDFQRRLMFSAQDIIDIYNGLKTIMTTNDEWLTNTEVLSMMVDLERESTYKKLLAESKVIAKDMGIPEDIRNEIVSQIEGLVEQRKAVESMLINKDGTPVIKVQEVDPYKLTQKIEAEQTESGGLKQTVQRFVRRMRPEAKGFLMKYAEAISKRFSGEKLRNYSLQTTIAQLAQVAGVDVPINHYGVMDRWEIATTSAIMENIAKSAGAVFAPESVDVEAYGVFPPKTPFPPAQVQTYKMSMRRIAGDKSLSTYAQLFANLGKDFGYYMPYIADNKMVVVDFLKGSAHLIYKGTDNKWYHQNLSDKIPETVKTVASDVIDKKDHYINMAKNGKAAVDTTEEWKFELELNRKLHRVEVAFSSSNGLLSNQALTSLEEIMNQYYVYDANEEKTLIGSVVAEAATREEAIEKAKKILKPPQPPAAKTEAPQQQTVVHEAAPPQTAKGAAIGTVATQQQTQTPKEPDRRILIIRAPDNTYKVFVEANNMGKIFKSSSLSMALAKAKTATILGTPPKGGLSVAAGQALGWFCSRELKRSQTGAATQTTTT